MNESIRKRIDVLKEKCGYETDTEIIRAIFNYKREHGTTGKVKDFEYIEKNKGSFSQAFKGERDFKIEDYLAIESVLNTSMAYIIEGKGEISDSFKLCGIRYAAYTDTVGNYDELFRDDIVNSSDEYNKMLIDYMIEFKSKNGFIYFAKKNLLPLDACGGKSFSSNCLHYYRSDNTPLLKTLCEVLPVDLLMKYFDGFFHFREIEYIDIDGEHYTSFTDEVLSEAIKRSDLRNALVRTKTRNIDQFNKGVKRINGEMFGEGVFVNFGLTMMLRYALSHRVDDEIREELLEESLKANKKCFEWNYKFIDDELKINKYGFITNRYGSICFGSIVTPSEPLVEISEKSKDLLIRLNMEIDEFHNKISKQSKMSVFANKIYSDKKPNESYYAFFKFMNDECVKEIPLLKENLNGEKDIFEIENDEELIPANGTEETLKEIIKVFKRIDEVSLKRTSGNTYFLVNPSIYMVKEKVAYIMPKDIMISNKYSNLVRLLNENAIWYLLDPNKTTKIKRFVSLIKTYGIGRESVEQFLEDFMLISEEQANAIQNKSSSNKELALKALENKSWVQVYFNDIIKEF